MLAAFRHVIPRTVARSAASLRVLASVPSASSLFTVSVPRVRTPALAMMPSASARTFCAAASGGEEPAVVQPPQPPPAAVGPEREHAFQAETVRLLQIVANSLYTDKEVFIRELVSNASDALEKLRHNQMVSAGTPLEDPDTPLEIRIDVDEKGGVFTITDTGIGMSDEEMVSNLGTIARSGSRRFVEAIEGGSAKPDIIGNFGVGFYSSFMVADEVKVWSKSSDPAKGGHVWTTLDGAGHFRIAPVDGARRGTRIQLKLRDSCKEFATVEAVKRVVAKYSSFVGFPILVNGQRVNTVGAVWRMSKQDVTQEMHNEFYRFVSNAFDDPMYSFQFSTDSPLDLRTVLYVPSMHMEKYGMGRMTPGLNVFSRKVLVQAKMQGLLPDWLRFVRGVVESEDIPLHISREHLQDSALIRKIGSVVSKRVIKFLAEEARRDPAKYDKFFAEFGQFIKEGLLTDANYKDELGVLLRYESTAVSAGQVTSFDSYLERSADKSDKADIYYLVASSRSVAELSPYYEPFKERGIEVVLLYSPIEEFVMTSLANYKGHPLVSIERSDLKIDQELKADKDKKKEAGPGADGKEGADPAAAASLTTEQAGDLAGWLTLTLTKEKVTSVTTTERLSASPCIVTDHEASSHRMRKLMSLNAGEAAASIPPQRLEINPRHPVIVGLYHAKDSDPVLASKVAEQLFDNALVSAGLLDDPRTMLKRLNALLEDALKGAKKN
jgi:TNF receptor-associated protein 1